jgi:hypothetical protein
MPSSPRRVTASVAACAVVSCVLLGSAAGQQGLDPVLAEYARGDHDVVARAFAQSNDFRKHDLFDRKKVEKWLGAWSPDKTAFMAELVVRASAVAPAYIPNLAATGQRYVLSRPSQPGAVPPEDDLERRWHLIALGVMQRHVLPKFLLQYVDGLRARRVLPAVAAVWDSRIDLAGGIAHEQQCRLLNATARDDRVLADLEGAAATPLVQRREATDCMRTALTMLEAAAEREEVRDEARTRAGFVAFQLGRATEAKALLDSARPGPDRYVAYWRALFTARVAEALRADADAEIGYRVALAAYPEAQSARIGLALALFRLNRPDEADTAMRAARQVGDEAVDPWRDYFAADGRFVGDWLAALRKARQ